MQDTLEFPPIADPAPATRSLAPLSIKATVLAQFTATETDLRTLAAKYANVAFDVATSKGLADAKAARLDLRENGRFMVERAEKRIKGEVNDLKSAMSAEVDRLVAIVRPHEDAIHAQIVAREEAIAAEKAEAERKAAEAARLEAERRQRLEDGITTIAGYVDKAKGKTAAQIAGGIDFVRGIVIDPEHWKDFTERAAATLADTLSKLDAMHAAQVKAEAEAAELAALRAEKAARDREDADIDRLNDLANECVARGSQYILDCIQELDEVLLPAVSKAARVQAHASLARNRMVNLLEAAQEKERKETEAAQSAAMAAVATVTTSAGTVADAATGEVLSEPNTQERACSPADAPAAVDAPRTNASNAPEAAGVPSGDEGPAAPATVSAAGPANDDPGPLETSEAEAIEPKALPVIAPAPLAAVVLTSPIKQHEEIEALRTQLRELAEHALSAFSGRFPSQPKPSAAWFARLRELAERVV